MLKNEPNLLITFRGVFTNNEEFTALKKSYPQSEDKKCKLYIATYKKYTNTITYTKVPQLSLAHNLILNCG